MKSNILLKTINIINIFGTDPILQKKPQKFQKSQMPYLARRKSSKALLRIVKSSSEEEPFNILYKIKRVNKINFYSLYNQLPQGIVKLIIDIIPKIGTILF